VDAVDDGLGDDLHEQVEAEERRRASSEMSSFSTGSACTAME